MPTPIPTPDPDRGSAPRDPVVREEEALLARTLEALASAARASRDAMRGTDELRALRDEARTASEDDLPGVLHEMGVRQRLRERAPDVALPDRACPYVAHLRVADERGERDYLLGSAGFFDARAGVRIVDWRTAPIARVFYRYREGDEYEEEIADRTITGRVIARRVVVIEDGRLTRILDGERSLARTPEGWAEDGAPQLAAGGAGTAARAGVLGVGVGARDRAARPEVTALLDAEQDAAIALPSDRPLLVIGSAGSGKTTVALHRLARLAAAEPARHPLDRVRTIVPEEGLARLSRRLLEPLGVPGTQVETIDGWALALAREVFGSVPRIGQETPAVVARLKRHAALRDALRKRFARLDASRTATLRRVQRLLSEPLTDRSFLASVIDASEGDLPRHAIEETVRHTMRQLAEAPEKELARITDAQAKTAVDGRVVWEGTPDETAGSVDLEDLPLFLALRAWSAGSLALRQDGRIAHLVVDEAEDVSLLELDVLRALLDAPPSVTLAGDDAQRTGTGFAGWDRALDALGARTSATTVRLAVSYRCPRPIVELAQRVLGDEAPHAPARAAREGAPVAIDAFPDEAHAHLVLGSALGALIDREPRASIAVIAGDEETAIRVHAALADLPSTRLVLDGAFTFEPGLDVTHVDAVKGLEWDYVVVPDATARAYPDEREARRRLHVALTRASHQAWLLAGGERTPILG